MVLKIWRRHEVVANRFAFCCVLGCDSSVRIEQQISELKLKVYLKGGGGGEGGAERKDPTAPTLNFKFIILHCRPTTAGFDDMRMLNLDHKHIH